MTKEYHRRKWQNFLISKDIQLRLAIYNLIFLLFAIGAVMATTLIPLYVGFQDPESLWSQHFSAKFFIVTIDRLALVSAGILVLAFIFQIVISHRFTGPLINFGKTFQKISRGDLTRKIFLRRKDFLHKEASQVNTMTASLARLIAEIKTDTEQLHLTLENAGGGKIKDAQIEDTLHEATARAGRCKASLSKFKIPFDSNTEID